MISGTFLVLTYAIITKKKNNQNKKSELGATLTIRNYFSDTSYEGMVHMIWDHSLGKLTWLGGIPQGDWEKIVTGCPAFQGGSEVKVKMEVAQLSLFAIPRNSLIKTRWPLNPREWQPHRVGSVRCSDGGSMRVASVVARGGHWWQRRWAHKPPGTLPGKKLKVTSYWSLPKATRGWGSVSYTPEGFPAYSLTASLMFPGFQAFSLFLCCLWSPDPSSKV